MTAQKRKKSRAQGIKTDLNRSVMSEEPRASHSSPQLEAAIRWLEQADQKYSRAVPIVSRAAHLARTGGHSIMGAILDRVAILWSMAGKTPDEFEHDIEKAGKLWSWLPLADELMGLSPRERKAWITVYVLGLGIDLETREKLTREMTQKPGAPQTTRKVAIYALELRREGKEWEEIARILPCDWTMVNNPGNAIRRQVQFLKRTLNECSVSLEGI